MCGYENVEETKETFLLWKLSNNEDGLFAELWFGIFMDDQLTQIIVFRCVRP
jgi:hypothetical protein